MIFICYSTIHHVERIHAYLDCTAEMECVIRKIWDWSYCVEHKALAWRLFKREHLELCLKSSPMD